MPPPVQLGPLNASKTCTSKPYRFEEEGKDGACDSAADDECVLD